MLSSYLCLQVCGLYPAPVANENMATSWDRWLAAAPLDPWPAAHAVTEIVDRYSKEDRPVVLFALLALGARRVGNQAGPLPSADVLRSRVMQDDEDAVSSSVALEPLKHWMGVLLDEVQGARLESRQVCPPELSTDRPQPCGVCGSRPQKHPAALPCDRTCMDRSVAVESGPEPCQCMPSLEPKCNINSIALLHFGSPGVRCVSEGERRESTFDRVEWTSKVEPRHSRRASAPSSTTFSSSFLSFFHHTRRPSKPVVHWRRRRAHPVRPSCCVWPDIDSQRAGRSCRPFRGCRAHAALVSLPCRWARVPRVVGRWQFYERCSHAVQDKRRQSCHRACFLAGPRPESGRIHTGC
jgi:hypothetical protein